MFVHFCKDTIAFCVYLIPFVPHILENKESHTVVHSEFIVVNLNLKTIDAHNAKK